MTPQAARPTAVTTTALDWLVSRTWWIFAAWAALWGTVHGVIWSGKGWFYFVDGAHALFSSDGLHLYAAHSELQIGPLSFVAVAPLVFGLPHQAGEVAAMVLMSAAGLVVLAQLRRLVPSRDAMTDRAFLLAGLGFLLVWSELAVTYAHPDDVLAILLTVLSLRALRSGRAGTGALLLALAAGCKPWALAFVPLLLLVERRDLLRAAAVWAAAVAAVWLPFVLADHRTLSAGGYKIANSMASSLRVFGVHSAGTPSWARAAQLALGIALAAVVVARGRWSAVILVVVAARLLLDPSVKSYYDAGLLTGSVLCDLVLLGGPIPALTLSAALVFYLPMFPLEHVPHTYGLLRTAYLVTVVLAVTALPDRILRHPSVLDAGRRPG